MSEWTKRKKGNATIYLHPKALEGRAIVVNFLGITFNGEPFHTLEEAKEAALKDTSDAQG